MKMLGRVGLWACSLCLSALIFSLAFSELVNGAAAVNPFFLVTVKLALPAWCLYLPLVVLLKNGEEWRMRVLLLAGALIGPVTVLAMAIVALARGMDARSVWQGDPLDGIGAAAGAVFAAIVGILTAGFYVAGLKVLFSSQTADSPQPTDAPDSALE